MSQSFVLDTLAVRKEASLVLERGGWKSMTLFREIKTDDPEVLVRVKVIGEVISLGILGSVLFLLPGGGRSQQ